jgi:hypothetical protein
MGKLRVTFKLGLAHPTMYLEKGIVPPVVKTFSDTGNTVIIEPPSFGPPTGPSANLGAFNEIVLHVDRECSNQEGQDASGRNIDRLSITRDAGRAFWMFFENLRDVESLEGTFAGFPVAQAEIIGDNQLLRSCVAEWTYNGVRIQPLISFGGYAAIPVRQSSWVEAARRLGDGERVPAHRSFAADAFYFAISGDPPRAIIMACAAWETALRAYLKTEASKRDPAYALAAKSLGISRLYEYAKLARGGPVFFDDPAAVKDGHAKRIEKLPEVRNKLLHAGEWTASAGEPLGYAIAVLHAIAWLFRASTP